MGKTKTENRTAIFENVPIPKAVALLCVPTIISSLVMVLYNLAYIFCRDTERSCAECGSDPRRSCAAGI